MKKYELVVILNANKKKEEIESLVSFVEKAISDADGKNISKDEWGEKELAYLINKQNKGYYIFFNFESTGEKNIDLENKFNMNADVFRYLIIKDEKEKIMKKLKAREERKTASLARRAAEREAREKDDSYDKKRSYRPREGNRVEKFSKESPKREKTEEK